MLKYIVVGVFTAFFFMGCASHQHMVVVDSTPSDALVSVYSEKDETFSKYMIIAGNTPLSRNLDFGSKGVLWLGFEKRGYQAKMEEILPETGTVTVHLEKIKDGNKKAVTGVTPADIHRVLIFRPDVKVTQRSFSEEKVLAEASTSLQDAILTDIPPRLPGTCMVERIETTESNRKHIKALWRDVRSQMELCDPVRLKYRSIPPVLETKSSRNAGLILGNGGEGTVMLFISGNQNVETTGLQLGTSLVNEHSPVKFDDKAISSGGLLIKAALIDCSQGEILWIGRGGWNVVVSDLLSYFNH